MHNIWQGMELSSVRSFALFIYGRIWSSAGICNAVVVPYNVHATLEVWELGALPKMKVMSQGQENVLPTRKLVLLFPMCETVSWKKHYLHLYLDIFYNLGYYFLSCLEKSSLYFDRVAL